MKKSFLLFTAAIISFTPQVFGQVLRPSKGDLIEILKAEDARRYDAVLEKYFDGGYDEKFTVRALLAAGRIGNEKAVLRVAALLNSGSVKVREMAAFALGEIESVSGADAVLKTLSDSNAPASVRARAVEAAGKIAAANAKDEKAKQLGEAILDTLETEDKKADKQDRNVVRLALTAALVARPEDGDIVVMKFLTNLDPRIRADAANTLARLRSKIANAALRSILMSDDYPIARANAARALGAAEDTGSFDMLLVAATEDDDARVRVSAIRSLVSLKDPMAVNKLLDRGEKLLIDLKHSKSTRPNEISELLEIATVLGRLVPNTNDSRTLKFLQSLRVADKFRSPETEIAYARTAPVQYSSVIEQAYRGFADWHVMAAAANGLGEVANSNSDAAREKAAAILADAVGRIIQNSERGSNREMVKAIPDIIRSISQFKPSQPGRSSIIFRRFLVNDDPFVRATAAELLGGQPFTKENIEALIAAFARSLQTDMHDNDAQLAILSAIVKLDKNAASGPLKAALAAPDFLVRRSAANLIRQNDLAKDFPGFEKMVGPVRIYEPSAGTRLGQILNTDADYKRAASRKNGRTKAVLTTQKGTFTIDLLPEDAPLTVDNFIKLARSRYFNGVAVHRVVPNFVMQDGDPRGDGNGGPGWSIRCEINMAPFDRGAVGMALSGKDTGGSQWFVTHSQQPHLDGGYTVFGRVNEKDMKVVDNIVRGDKIISVKIIEGNLPQRHRGTVKRKRP